MPYYLGPQESRPSPIKESERELKADKMPINHILNMSAQANYSIYDTA